MLFNRYVRPFVPGFRVRPQNDVPGFNLDENSFPSERAWPDGMPPGTLTRRYPDAAQALAQPFLGFPTPSPQLLAQSAPPTGLAGFRAKPQDDVPGFNLRLEDAVPGFNVVGSGSGVQRQETTWSDGTRPGSAPLQYSDTAPMLTLPGMEDSTQPVPPQLPEWLYKLVTMPLPQSSTAFDPRTGRRVVPYAPLIGPVRSYLTTDQNARGTGDARPYVDGISPPPDLVSVEATSAERQVPWPAAMMPQPIGVPSTLSVKPVADSNFILANAGDVGEPQAQQQRPLPQDQPTQQKIPVTPPGTGLASRPPALRVPEKPGMEITELERRPEQELSRFIEEHRRAAADLAEELASAIASFGNRFYHDSILKPGDDLARLAERFANDPGKTTLSVLNSFPQTRVEGEFLAGIAAVFTILANAARGLAFERAVLDALNAARNTTKIKKNTSKIGVEGLGRSVPDILLQGITEIKSGLEIDSSVQLRVQAAYAKVTGVPFNLIVSPTTQRVSEQVKKQIFKTGGTIQRFDPATGTFTPFK